VLCFRAVILHKDIASKNIVLDEMFNARLIDFGLAREEDDISTIAGGRFYYLHPNIGKEGANESWDYYSFGVSKCMKLQLVKHSKLKCLHIVPYLFIS
jgi:serine/threonine protein kinase